MRTMFTRLRLSENGKEFMETRDLIGKFFFVLFAGIYAAMWVIYEPHGTPLFSYIFTFLMIPLILFGLHVRCFHFLFLYNWYYVLYYVVTGIFFFVLVSIFAKRNDMYNNNYVGYEFCHLLLINSIGVGVGIVVGLPFKLVHWFLFDNKVLYFDMDILDMIDRKLFPEKHEDKIKKELETKKESFKYDTLNETQLHAELALAINEERFEDAAGIRKLLETKFR